MIEKIGRYDEKVACHAAEYPDSRKINSFPDSRKINSFPDSQKISPYFLPLKSICGGNCTVDLGFARGDGVTNVF